MYFSKKDKLVTEIYLKSLGTKKKQQKNKTCCLVKNIKRTISFHAKIWKTQNLNSKHNFHGIIFMIKMLKNIKKIRMKYFLFHNLSAFIISVFQKNSEFLKFSLRYGFLRNYLTTEKDLFIFIKNKKRWMMSLINDSHVIFLENLNEIKKLKVLNLFWTFFRKLFIFRRKPIQWWYVRIGSKVYYVQITTLLTKTKDFD